MTIGQRIAQKRKELGLSQEALGSKLGVSRQSIYKWEADSALPEVDKLIALSRLFGVTTDYLLGLTDTPEPPFPVSASERELLTLFRTLSREQKELIAKNVDLMVQQNQR